jgi:hypothetical protein
MADEKNNSLIEIKDTSIAFRLGEISAKLENNDVAHTTIFRKLDTISKQITDLTGDVGNIKGRAAAYGGVVGFIVSIVVAVVGWFVSHIAVK